MKNLMSVLLYFLIFSCATQKKKPIPIKITNSVVKKMDTNLEKPKENPANFSNALSEMLDGADEFKNSNVGLLIYDPTNQNIIYSKNADKNFIPASNVKILTLYTCLKTLGDSIPAMKYTAEQNTIKIWGLGDPTFLHPDFPTTKTYDFLKKYRTIQFSSTNSTINPVGDGWSWDDYNEDYFIDRNIFPIYANIVRVQKSGNRVLINPNNMAMNFINDGKVGDIKRDLDRNNFHYGLFTKPNFKQDIPFKTSDTLVAKLLTDTLQREVVLTKELMPANSQTFYSSAIDTVYKKMMYVSDNMLAEQLLLLTCNPDSVSTENAIRKAKMNIIHNLPQEIRWMDGSGNSRYNLITPTDLVFILDKMLKEIPQEKLLALFPSGGKTGTLKNSYQSTKPFVFAKTGSMSGVYNQSGYIITDSGKLLIFSFMNNNFIGPISKVRNATNLIMTWVASNYSN